MRIHHLDEGVGRIVKGVNTTPDVGPNQTSIEAAKFGNTVDKDGRPPTMSKNVKGNSTNVLFNLGLTEGIKLRLERDKNMDILHIQDTNEKSRVEVRGKKDYESGGYDANDKLHQVLDRVGKAANISDLMNGDIVHINPNHPQGTRAIRTARDVLQTEQQRFTAVEWACIEGGHDLNDLYKQNSKDKKPGAIFEALNNMTEAFDTDSEWVSEPGPGGATVFATKVDDAYIEITYKPMSKGVYISFTRGGVMSVTGEGGQNKIFGAVINHIKKWVAENNPQEIYFSAFKPRTGAFGSQDSTRSGLYRKIVQRFASQNGYDYDVEDTGNEDTFILKRQGVEKSSNSKEIAVHRSSEKFSNIDLSKSADGTFWLAAPDADWDNIVTTGKGVEHAYEISPNAKLASWDDIDKYSIDELENMGYDGVRMVDGKDISYQIWNTDILSKTELDENFADGKKKGKSRPGRVKRAGASCNGSVTALRKRAKNASGEKAKMLHWCANMKSGRKKK